MLLKNKMEQRIAATNTVRLLAATQSGVECLGTTGRDYDRSHLDPGKDIQIMFNMSRFLIALTGAVLLSAPGPVSAQSTAGGLRVGAAKVDITPQRE